MLQIYDRVLSSYSLPTLYVLTVAAVLSLIVMGLLEFVRSRLLVRCGVEIDHTISKDVLENVIKMASSQTKPGRQASLRDVNILRNFFAGNAIFTLFDIPWTPLFLGVIYLLHPLLGIVATTGAFLLLIFGIINEFATRKPLNAANTVNTQLMTFVETARRNSASVISMGMVKGITQKWSRFNDTVTKLQTQASRRSGTLQSLSSWLRQSMQVFIYGVGAWLVLHSEATPGIMIAASIIMGRALAPVQQSIGAWKNMIEAKAAWKRLDTLFTQPEKVSRMDLPTPDGRIKAEAVNFILNTKPILKNINFDLAPGESLGVIGPSGAGKSTLCQLLIGMWPANSGKIRLDGNDIFSWEAEKIGPYLGYLSQDVELFRGSIADNIARMGDVDSEKVIDAAQQTGVHQFVLDLPEGYDTLIGEGGLVLSGGQRQRIGLARAFYGAPKVVVLDEPNSNLDADGEVALVESFRELKQKKSTLIVVSHKPSLLTAVDKILVLKDGQVAAFGPQSAVLGKFTTKQIPPARQNIQPLKGKQTV